MSAQLLKFVDETCVSGYESKRLGEALVKCGIADMASLHAMGAVALEAGIRAQGLVDEVWVLGSARRIHEAARAEVSRLKAARRVPTSPMRGKVPANLMQASVGGVMDSVEEEVKRMRLQ